MVTCLRPLRWSVWMTISGLTRVDRPPARLTSLGPVSDDATAASAAALADAVAASASTAMAASLDTRQQTQPRSEHRRPVHTMGGDKSAPHKDQGPREWRGKTQARSSRV